jgi:inorganic pyrophosphatase
MDLTADVFIEIAKGSHIKYEYDKQRKALVCDRILHTPFKYEFNYGFIPETLSQDGDPLDVIVVMEDDLIPGSFIQCKFIGLLETEDDAGIDPKIIMCPCDKVDPVSREINNLKDLSSIKLERIKYFFTHYKDLEHKKVRIGDFKDRIEAIHIFNESVDRYAKKSKEYCPVTKNKITSYFDIV